MAINLAAWVSEKKNLQMWINWRKDPITQLMIQGLKDERIQSRMIQPNGDEAIQTVGYIAGRDAVIFKLENLDQFVDVSEAESDEPTVYAMRTYLKDAGYTDKEIDKKLKSMREGE